tara:strand:+ start:6842 stop:8932 length:2091 start_codon:yes stop_codon:yes gene_type:complete
MADKVYIVTLKRREDLEEFYTEMEADGFKLSAKRPISRNTHYYMSDEQAEQLRKDGRVLAVELTPDDIPHLELTPYGVDVGVYNYAPHGHGTEFRKSGTYQATDRDWGKLHVAGNDGQRRKYQWPSGSVTDNVDIFSDGRHVDVVICDDPVSFDMEDWKAISDNRDRFQMYDWYGELNQYVSSIDDDGQSIPSAPYTQYISNGNNTNYHGTHVAGTVAGKWYGWAPEANIYSLRVLGSGAVPALLIFDYLRAFHAHKPINLETGFKNPTVTNHSYGWSTNLTSTFDNGIGISSIEYVTYRGTTYDSNNPNPSGWSMQGLEDDFGISQWKRMFNYNYSAITADVEDAIEDGVVVIIAAGNNDFYMPKPDPTDPSYVDWNNAIKFQGLYNGISYYQRGSSPGNAKNAICVGAIDNDDDFRRASFSNFGPAIDVWAPGYSIVSTYNNTGTYDTKYGGTNYYDNINGTSMASPQVCGVAACIATGKTRFTQSDMYAYIQQFGKEGDMSFDVSGGDFSDPTCKGANGGLFFDGDCPEIRLTPPRPIQGYMGGWYKECLHGKRRNKEVIERGQVQLFPRTNSYHRALPQDLSSKTFNYTVGYSGGQYTFTGQDRQASHSNNQQPTINLVVGDTINFAVNVSSSHPFYIKTVQGTGTGNQVTTPSASGQGSYNGTVSWTPNTSGTYFYQCRNHNSMHGEIIVA